ncbi:hypothetical protein B0A49_09015 [Cryomyces minteri]|uniref:Uncharacterized protein n=2 Tax=Cryomyces TaxID=329878 RepID=A0A4U0WDC4_9PEZI|nr:hypothetical protein B0A49_09015 [Cryomyces minteri]
MASTNIPLHCNICPKKPDFSDVSHLLTHIASKGHLSHYYKVKVRAGSEDYSRQLIEAYDRWYAEWKMEDLMSQRMNLKERKRLGTRGSVNVQSSRQSSLAPVFSTSQRRGRPTNCAIDPRLASQQIKTEHRSPSPFVDPASYGRGYTPQMRFWPPTKMETTSSKDKDSECSSEGSMGIERRHAKLFDFDASTNTSLGDEDVFEDSLVSECTKLKGVFWPGMNIFDSATPEMRRKRNQKKSTSVVEQLELNSQDVEATELIFTPAGSFKKQRKISGLPEDDSSPVKMERPSPKPRKRAARREPLSARDPNVPGLYDFNHGRPSFFDPPPILYSNDDEAEMRLAYGNFGQKRKRGFEVFQDQEVSFGQPASLSYLTSEFHHPQSQYVEPSLLSNMDLTSFTPSNSFRYVDENGNVEPAALYQTNHCSGGMSYQPTYLNNVGHDLTNFLTNPLFFGSYQAGEDDDDGQTISASPSDV